MSRLHLSLGFSLLLQVYGKYEDLSWKMALDRVSYFPGGELIFKYTLTNHGPFDFGKPIPFGAWGSYATEEHLFTHMDAPNHFSEEGKSVDEIPLDDLVGPLVKVNITSRASEVKDAEVTVDDLVEWENKHGTIPSRSFVLMHSGWDKFYGDNAKYLGSNDVEGPFHFPGFSTDAARWLLNNRNILGLGSDSLSCDSMSHIFDVHQIILPAGKVCIENLKNIDRVPECGAKFMMFPIPLKNGTGVQGRAISEWYPGTGYKTSCKGKLKQAHSFCDSGVANALVSHSCYLFCHFILLFRGIWRYNL